MTKVKALFIEKGDIIKWRDYNGTHTMKVTTNKKSLRTNERLIQGTILTTTHKGSWKYLEVGEEGFIFFRKTTKVTLL